MTKNIILYYLQVEIQKEHQKFEVSLLLLRSFYSVRRIQEMESITLSFRGFKYYRLYDWKKMFS